MPAKKYRLVNCLAEILRNVVMLNQVSSCISVALDTDGPFWDKFGFSGCWLFDPVVEFPYNQVL